MAFQQTVERAIRTETGEVLEAADLLSMPGEEFVALRRSTMRDREGLQAAGASPTLICWVCGTRLWLARKRHQVPDPERGETENRFFRHDAGAVAEQCPWYDPSKFTKEQLLALRFHGQREGRRHLELKAFLARMLERDAPRTTDVLVEKVQPGEVLKGQWKKPDVRCRFGQRRVVFELQISYTFISEVVKRDAFYQAEHSFIIWVFAEINERRAVVLDEKYYNKRNLFVLDDAAKAESERRGCLALHCYYWIPRRQGESIANEAAEAFVTLEDLRYPENTYRPHFFDYDKAFEQIINEITEEQDRAEAEAKLEAAARRRADQEFRESVDAKLAQAAAQRKERMPPPLGAPRESMIVSAGPQYKAFTDALLSQGRSARAAQAADDAVSTAASEIPDPQMRTLALEALQYPRFQTLVRLVGIAEGLPVMTQRKDVYSMLANILQVSAATQRPFAFLYCATWLAYRPWLKPAALSHHRKEIQSAMDRDDREYRMNQGFATLCSWLIPRLARSVRLRSLCADWSISKGDPPRWQRETKIRREHVATVGRRFVASQATTDWRAIYADALELRNAAVPFRSAIVEIAGQRSIAPADVFAFLEDCFT